jgi:hypothetical protein
MEYLRCLDYLLIIPSEQQNTIRSIPHISSIPADRYIAVLDRLRLFKANRLA